MPRFKDYEWNMRDGSLNQDGVKSFSSDTIKVSVMMDIRDELKKLNQLLHCIRFQNIPSTLSGIRRDLAQKRKPKEKKHGR